jgi:hypothetical protein
MALRHLLNGIPLAAATNSGLPYVATISGISAGTGTVNAIVTTAAPHLLADNQAVTIAAVTTATALNATWLVKVLTSTTFELVGTAAITATPGGSPTYTIPTMDISDLGSVLPNLQIQCAGDGVLEIQDTVDGFSALRRIKVLDLAGEQNVMLNFGDFGDLHRFGTTSARLRLVCTVGSFTRVACQTKV